MNKISKMAAVLMSAVLCTFTSCGESSGDKNEDDVLTIPEVKFALVITPEVLGNVEGTVTAQFLPSGKSKTVNIKEATGKFDDEMLARVESYNNSSSGRYTDFLKQSGSITCELKGALNDTAFVLSRNIKAKDDLDFSADKTYYYELLVPYKVTYYHSTELSTFAVGGGRLPGNLFQGYCERNNTTRTVKFNK